LCLSQLTAEIGEGNQVSHHGSAGLSSVRGPEVLRACGLYPDRVTLELWEAQGQASGAWLQVPMQAAG